MPYVINFTYLLVLAHFNAMLEFRQTGCRRKMLLTHSFTCANHAEMESLNRFDDRLKELQTLSSYSKRSTFLKYNKLHRCHMKPLWIWNAWRFYHLQNILIFVVVARINFTPHIGGFLVFLRVLAACLTFTVVAISISIFFCRKSDFDFKSPWDWWFLISIWIHVIFPNTA